MTNKNKPNLILRNKKIENYNNIFSGIIEHPLLSPLPLSASFMAQFFLPSHSRYTALKIEYTIIRLWQTRRVFAHYKFEKG